MNDRTEAVRRFYERAPFPGYPPSDSLAALRARARRSPFAALLDRSIADDARIVDVGCGTGQMCLYLARPERTVVGVDVTRASLQLGAEAARRFDLERVRFVEMDLQRPGLLEQSFDVVYSSGVIHHTANPRGSFASLVRLVKPGGMLVVGVYNTIARVPTHLRRAIARLTRFHVIPFDPVLRERDAEPERRAAWLRDQYQHPEEHCHSIREVQRWFAENGVEYLRTYPSAVFDDAPENLFTPAPDDWWLERGLAQLGWMSSLGREGGLFFTIGRWVPDYAPGPLI
ncbi:MAG TPA: class I SAM-dependent methyltransferase [Vicinamibacterales bacterium]|nr:class I SAM-dependent methyltransferase [Vicinamibacterales bacterium]